MKLSDKLPKYIAALLSFATFIGIIHNFLYYWLFHIDYFAFSDLTEILSTYLSSLAFLFVILSGQFSFIFGMYLGAHKAKTYNDPFTTLKNPKARRIITNIVYLSVLLVFILAIYLNTVIVYAYIFLNTLLNSKNESKLVR